MKKIKGLIIPDMEPIENIQIEKPSVQQTEIIKDKPKETELNLVKVLSKHLNCIYVCNNKYITVTDLVGETIQGIKDDNTRVPLETPEEALNYKHIQIKDCVYTKTSPISYILSKYFSDRNSREVLNLGLADLHKEIEGLVNGEEE